MIAEIRTYTANRGKLDELISVLNEVVFANHRAYGIDVIGLWADRPQNQVTWIRTFESVEDRTRKLADYEASDARQAALPRMIPNIAKPPEARILEDVFSRP